MATGIKKKQIGRKRKTGVSPPKGWQLSKKTRKERNIVSFPMPTGPNESPYDLWSFYRPMAHPQLGLCVVRTNRDGWCKLDDGAIRYVGTEHLFETEEDAKRYVALLWLKGTPA